MIAITAFIAVGCNGGKEDIVLDSVSVDVESLDFGPEGGTKDVRVSSSGDWRLSGISDWVETSVTGGSDGQTISFKAAPNESSEVKESSFKVFTGTAVTKITVRSTPVYFIEVLSDYEFSFSSEGGSPIVKIRTNVSDLHLEYSGDGQNWISLVERADAFGYSLLKFDVAASEIFKARESAITMSGKDKSASISFRQAQKDAVFAEEAKLVVQGLDSRDITLTLKTNIDVDFSLADWMEKKEDVTSDPGDDGLSERRITIRLAESAASRFYTIDFKSGEDIMASVYVKQQNPNPVMADISDETLRNFLTDQGWIIAEPGSTKCEVLEKGLTGTTLTIGHPRQNYDVKIVDGLSAFPMLASLTINRLNVETIDLSDCRKVEDLSINSSKYVGVIKLGSSPVRTVKFGESYAEYLLSDTITISGENVETVSMNFNWYTVWNDEKLRILDVTGLPKLTTLKAKRENNNQASIKTIYVTAAQKAAIDAGTLTVEKSDLTTIEVK